MNVYSRFEREKKTILMKMINGGKGKIGIIIITRRVKIDRRIQCTIYTRDLRSCSFPSILMNKSPRLDTYEDRTHVIIANSNYVYNKRFGFGFLLLSQWR